MWHMNQLTPTGSLDESTLAVAQAAASPDLTPTAKTDFYKFANQELLEKGSIPPGYQAWGAFQIAQKNADAKVQTIIDEAKAATHPTYEQQVIAALYDGYLNTQARNANRLHGIQPHIEAIEKSNTLDEWFTVQGQLSLAGVTTPIAGGPTQSLDDGSKIIIGIGQPNLALPSRDYYVDLSNAELSDQFKTHITKLFELAGLPATDAQKAYDFEMQLGTASLPLEDIRDPQKNNNPMSYEEFLTTSKLSWNGFFAAMGIQPKGKQVNLATKPYVAAAENVVLKADLPTLKAWSLYNLIRTAAGYATEALDNEAFHFNGTILAGITGRRPAAERALQRLNGVDIGSYAIGRVYVEKHFPKSTQDQLNGMVNNVKNVLKDRIQNHVTWMSPETKQAALKKLEGITVLAGVPDVWPTFSSPTLSTDYLANIFAFNVAANQVFLPYLNEDKTFVPWTSPPQVTNAEYDPQARRYTFYAGLFNAPFYETTFDDAALYGAIGAVIGHELTHAFDSLGSQFDANGSLKNWWTEADTTAFEALTKKLSDYTASQTYKDGTHLNGELFLSEATADLGGITIAYEAFKNTDAYKQNAVVDGYTARQRFFLQFAHVWGQLITDQAEKQAASADPHPPAFYRTNGTLSQFAPFYEAFNIQPGDPMYIAPDQHVMIW